MKRAWLVATLVSVVLVVASGVALAANIHCPNRPDNGCVGTKNADHITGTPQSDQIRARGGDDLVNARGGEGDFAIGGSGEDHLRGEAGPDNVIGGSIGGNFETGDLKFSDSQDDVVRGQDGNDPTVAGGFGRGGRDRLYGGEGNDTMYAAQRHFPFRGNVRVNKEIVDCGPGDDTAYYDKGVDVVRDNCETKVPNFPEMRAAIEQQGSGARLFVRGSE